MNALVRQTFAQCYCENKWRRRRREDHFSCQKTNKMATYKHLLDALPVVPVFIMPGYKTRRPHLVLIVNYSHANDSCDHHSCLLLLKYSATFFSYDVPVYFPSKARRKNARLHNCCVAGAWMRPGGSCLEAVTSCVKAAGAVGIPRGLLVGCLPS